MSCSAEEVTPDNGGTDPAPTLTVGQAQTLFMQPNPANGQGVWNDLYGWQTIAVGSQLIKVYHNMQINSDSTITWSQEPENGFCFTGFDCVVGQLQFKSDNTPVFGKVSFRYDPARPTQLQLVLTPIGNLNASSLIDTVGDSTFYRGSMTNTNRVFLDGRTFNVSNMHVLGNPVYLDVIELSANKLHIRYEKSGLNSSSAGEWFDWTFRDSEGSLARQVLGVPTRLREDGSPFYIQTDYIWTR